MKNILIITLLIIVSAVASFARSDKNKAEKVDVFVRDKMSANHIPGLSLAVVRNGKIVFAKGFGMANLELSVPANEKTAFAIYSITKTFTAVATMMLVEEGKISLEDPISKYLADLPADWKPITIRQLLNNTSGIKDFAPVLFESGDVLRDYTQPEVLKLVAADPLDFPSGEQWNYTNTGFYLLGMLIEKVSGKTYEQFLTARIFVPLDMRDTRFENHETIIPNRADGYTWQNDGYRNAVKISPTLSFSAAGLVSTVLDLTKWDAALNSEKLLQKSTLEQMWTNAKLNNGQIVSEYGLGFGLTPYQGHRRVGHVGGAAGFATAISRFVDDKVTVIVLSNADQEGFLLNDIANEIASYYFAR